MHLTDGNIVKINSNGERIEKILFQVYDFPIFSADFASNLLDKDSMKTSHELGKIINNKRLDYQSEIKNPFPNQIELDAQKEARKSITKSEIELYTRILSLPQIVLFVLLGFSLGIKKGRGGSSNNTIRAIVILLGYYGLYFFLLSLSQRGILDSLLATFIPCTILFFLTFHYYKKLDWVG
jgi:lipopolysaccharide export system permease protein